MFGRTLLGLLKPPEGDSVSDLASNEAPEQDNDAVLSVESTSEAPPTDIQAILTVIARRKGYYGNGEPEPLDLQGTDLRGSSALGRRGRVLISARGRGPLEEAHILQGSRVHLEKANLQGTNLSKAYLERANLEEANLSKANLLGANLEEANLQGANLQGANLQDANLIGANLIGTNLQDANLIGAKGLAQEQIDWAIGDEATTLPDGLDRPVAWSKRSVEEQTGILERRLYSESGD